MTITKQQIKDAFATGIASNPSMEDALRDARRDLRDAAEMADDLIAAQNYIGQTAPAALTVERWEKAIDTVLSSLPTMSWTGARGIQALRDRLRALLVHADTPVGIKYSIQDIKRTYKISQDGSGNPICDRESTDPIEAATTAALAVISASDSTKAEIDAASETIKQYVALTFSS